MIKLNLQTFAFDLAAAQSVLKEDYHGPVKEQLNNENPIITKLVENVQEATGKRFFVPLHVGRNNGVGYRAEGAALPTAGQQKYDDTTANTKYLYGSIEITGPTIKAMRNDKGAFIRAVDSEMKGLLTDLKDQRARALFGNGTGSLATTAAATGNAIVVNKVKYLQVGQKIDIVDNTNTVKVSGRTITAINKATKTITIDGAPVTTVSTDYIIISGNLNNEIMGLGGIVSDTLALQGLNPATPGEEFWKAMRYAAGGSNRALSTSLMRLVLDDIDVAGGKTDWITASHGVRAAYEALLQPQVRYTNAMTLEGGVKTLEYDGRPIFVDRYHEGNQMYFLDRDSIDLYQLSDFEWMEDDKGAVLRPVAGKDAYGATLFCYETLVTYRRNVNAVLADLTEPTGY